MAYYNEKKEQNGFWNADGKKELFLEDLEGIAGGVLPNGWEQMVDSMAPSMMK